LWNRNQLPGDIAIQKTPLLPAPERIRFQAVIVPGLETVFGKSTKRWGDDWQLQQLSAQTSPKPESKLFTQRQMRKGEA
jgi:hypothetical protein